MLLRPFVLIVLGVGLLTACDLRPRYSETVQQELARIHVLPIAEREGQALKIALNEQLNPYGLDLPTAYRLQLSLSFTVQQSFSDASGIRRARGTVRATGNLVDLSGTQIWAGTVQQAGLFAQSDLPSLSAVAQEDLWVDLADLIARDLKGVLADALSDQLAD